MMEKNAFTLIELLIVVAIIAILAAIAVPNFLEAQTRAKVTRVVSDMRTLGLALESYYVDNNKYIPAISGRDDGRWHMWFMVFENDQGGINMIGSELTTPISYITDIPTDPFTTLYARLSGLSAGGGVDWGGVRKAGVLYTHATKTERYPIDWSAPSSGELIRDVGYYMLSTGPNILMGGHEGSGWWYVYDPTNGTVSNGDIFYLGKSHGFRGGNVK